MMPTPQSRESAVRSRVEAASDEVAAKLSTFLAGVPADMREAAIDAYRKITLQLLATRGLPIEQATPLVDQIVTDIRARVAAVERAGGSVAGRA